VQLHRRRQQARLQQACGAEQQHAGLQHQVPRAIFDTSEAKPTSLQRSGKDGIAKQRVAAASAADPCNACPLCNQLLAPASTLSGRTIPLGLGGDIGDGAGPLHLCTFPVNNPRVAGHATEAGVTGRWPLLIAHEPEGRSPPLLGLARSSSADRALAELGCGGATSHLRCGAGPMTAPPSPRAGPGLGFDMPGASTQAAVSATSADDVLRTAAEMAANGRRGVYDGCFACCTLVMTFTDPALAPVLSKLVKVGCLGHRWKGPDWEAAG
jgi:hypothetical protein